MNIGDKVWWLDEDLAICAGTIVAWVAEGDVRVRESTLMGYRTTHRKECELCTDVGAVLQKLDHIISSRNPNRIGPAPQVDPASQSQPRVSNSR